MNRSPHIPLKELSLFSGAGGGLLATKHLLRWDTVGYVEVNEYCQKVIAQRIKDGLLDEAPIFSDIRAFNREGYAESYSGMVDVVSGGFPCQDISCAGKGKGLSGEKSSLWFEMAETIRIVRPQYVFVENSPMLLIRGFDRVTSGLSEMGYDCRWGIISAADVGAPHLRKRLWVVADSKRSRTWDNRRSPGLQRWVTSETEPKVIRQRNGETRTDRVNANGKNVADTQSKPVRAGFCSNKQEKVWRGRFGNGGCAVADAIGYKYRRPDRVSWWEREPTEALQDAREGRGEKTWLQFSESELGRVANGMAHRVDRLRAIGNGQVSLVAATAWQILTSEGIF